MSQARYFSYSRNQTREGWKWKGRRNTAHEVIFSTRKDMVADYLNEDPAVVMVYARGGEESSTAIDGLRKYLNEIKSQ